VFGRPPWLEEFRVPADFAGKPKFVLGELVQGTCKAPLRIDQHDVLIKGPVSWRSFYLCDNFN